MNILYVHKTKGAFFFCSTAKWSEEWKDNSSFSLYRKEITKDILVQL